MSVIEVSIKSVIEDTRGKYEGATITGYNKTDDKGFKQFVFSSGQGKELYDCAMDLNGGDVAEITMEKKGSYENITKIVKIGSGGGQQSRGGGGGGGSDKAPSNKMSKAEWAAKDLAKERSITRQSALKAAVVACSADGGGVTKKKIEQIEKITKRFAAYLLMGDFDAIQSVPAIPEPPTTDSETPAPPADQDTPPGPQDDDIPF
jgi:hypothetical protein